MDNSRQYKGGYLFGELSENSEEKFERTNPLLYIYSRKLRIYWKKNFQTEKLLLFLSCVLNSLASRL